MPLILFKNKNLYCGETLV